MKWEDDEAWQSPAWFVRSLILVVVVLGTLYGCGAMFDGVHFTTGGDPGAASMP